TLLPVCPGAHSTAQGENHKSLMDSDIFSRLVKCVSLPFLRCVVQTQSLALNAFTALMGGRCRSFPWSSLLSEFSFPVRSVRNPRSSRHTSVDSSSCFSFLFSTDLLPRFLKIFF